MTASMFNPMEGLVDWEANSTDGPDFSQRFGWKDQSSLRDNERHFYSELWRVAFAHGRAQGQVDGVAYKSERTEALAKENTDLQNRLSEADAAWVIQTKLAEDLQEQLDRKHNDAALLEGERYKLEDDLRNAAAGLKAQRAEIDKMEKRVMVLVERNMKRLSYRAWHRVASVADGRMSKAHP